MDLTSYKIIRMYFDERPARIQKTGLTLKQAQEHCNDPETSSRTAKKGRNGCTSEWFDGYTEE